MPGNCAKDFAGGLNCRWKWLDFLSRPARSALVLVLMEPHAFWLSGREKAYHEPPHRAGAFVAARRDNASDDASAAVHYRFEDFSLDTDRRELTRGSELIAIGPQVFDLLVYLVKNHERVVSKNDLFQAVWGSRIVSESTLTSHINAVRKAIRDSGDEQRLIRTAARKGFRFVGEVRREQTASTSPHMPDGASEQTATPGLELALPDKPSVAVLPFQNLSGDPEQEYFADGMAEEIIAALSLCHWLFVIARNSSFTYKGQAVDIRQVGRELGVRYVLEGSVRRGGNRVRFTGQLIEAASGSHIWAGHFDGEMTDVFDLQDRITEKVVAAIEPKLQLAEIERLKRKPSPVSAMTSLVHPWKRRSP